MMFNCKNNTNCTYFEEKKKNQRSLKEAESKNIPWSFSSALEKDYSPFFHLSPYFFGSG